MLIEVSKSFTWLVLLYLLQTGLPSNTKLSRWGAKAPPTECTPSDKSKEYPHSLDHPQSAAVDIEFKVILLFLFRGQGMFDVAATQIISAPIILRQILHYKRLPIDPILRTIF